MFKVKCQGEYYTRENGIITEKSYEEIVAVDIPFYEEVETKSEGRMIIGNYGKAAGLANSTKFTRSNSSLLVKQIKEKDRSCLTTVNCKAEPAIWVGDKDKVQEYLDLKREVLKTEEMMLRSTQKGKLTQTQQIDLQAKKAFIEEKEVPFIKEKTLGKPKKQNAEA